MITKDKKCTGKVLILGDGTRSFLAVIRSLGRKNICVHVAWCEKNSAAIKSKYIEEYKDIPPFSLRGEDWKNVLKKILLVEQYDLVIPCDDKSIIPLQLNKSDFDRICKIYLLDNIIYDIVSDKFKMQEMAGNLKVRLPREVKINKSTPIENILSDFNFPIVLKPRYSFTPENLINKNFVTKIYNENDLKSYLSTLNSKEVISVQENFIGIGVGVELLAYQGVILHYFQHLRIHEPLEGGGSSYRKSVSINKELLEASKKIISELNYTGVAMVEFKMNMDSNDWIFIELNPRFWGSLPLAVASGSDFPYYLYSMLVEGKKQFPVSYKMNIYCRNLSMDLAWFITNLRANRLDPTLSTLHIRVLLLELFNIIFLREKNDTIVCDDILPGVWEIFDIFNGLRKKIFKKLLNITFFQKIQYKRTYKLIQKARNILFVCKGNICRSPFAENYLKHKLHPNLKIDSCGYYQQKDRICPIEAIEAANKFGINLNSHRSKIINEELVKNSDIIFSFDEENYSTIIKLYPYAKTKLCKIGTLNLDISHDIPDPYGKTIEFYTNTYKHIITLLNSMISNNKKTIN